jgi:hypothetical protein
MVRKCAESPVGDSAGTLIFPVSNIMELMDIDLSKRI